jgi:hypothetical protein
MRPCCRNFVRPGPRRSQIRLTWVETSRGSVLGPSGLIGTFGFAARPIEKSTMKASHRLWRPENVASRKSRSREIGMLSWEKASKLSRSRDSHFPRRPLS